MTDMPNDASTIANLRWDLATAKTELANQRAADIHSCGPTCTRAGCVNARLRAALTLIEGHGTEWAYDIYEARKIAQDALRDMP